jgi:hypothetical protein
MRSHCATVNSSEIRDGGLDHVADAGFVRDVGGDCYGSSTGSAHFARRTFRRACIDVRDDDARAFSSEAAYVAESDPFAATCDDHDLVLKAHASTREFIG